MEKNETKTCGIVMPISSIDGCNEKHWGDVLSIINDVIKEINFKPNLVSNADDVGVIHKRIVQNLYENPIVVCDVSANNPNVMFELGMRLAFDKATIIIKDDKTKYSFDTSSIEHIEYPRDLRFTDIMAFKEKLKDKILATYKKSHDNPDYSAFLKNFGEFKVAKIETKEVSSDVLILDEIKSLRASISRLDLNSEKFPISAAYSNDSTERWGSLMKIHVYFCHRDGHSIDENVRDSISNLDPSFKASLLKSSDERDGRDVLLVNAIGYTIDTLVATVEALYPDLKRVSNKL